MTEQTTADLIARAGEAAKRADWYMTGEGSLFRALAAAVEAAEQRAEEAEKSRGEWAFRAGDRDALEDQRNQLATVVEKVREYVTAVGGLLDVREIVASAPADLLREVKAAAWDEGYSHCFDFEAEDGGVSLLDNPYQAREEQT